MQQIANLWIPVRVRSGPPAQVVKLVDTRDLKSLGLNIRAGSTPALGTTKKTRLLKVGFLRLPLLLGQ